MLFFCVRSKIDYTVKFPELVVIPRDTGVELECHFDFAISSATIMIMEIIRKGAGRISNWL